MRQGSPAWSPTGQSAQGVSNSGSTSSGLLSHSANALWLGARNTSNQTSGLQVKLHGSAVPGNGSAAREVPTGEMGSRSFGEILEQKALPRGAEGLQDCFPHGPVLFSTYAGAGTGDIDVKDLYRVGLWVSHGGPSLAICRPPAP